MCSTFCGCRRSGRRTETAPCYAGHDGNLAAGRRRVFDKTALDKVLPRLGVDDRGEQLSYLLFHTFSVLKGFVAGLLPALFSNISTRPPNLPLFRPLFRLPTRCPSGRRPGCPSDCRPRDPPRGTPCGRPGRTLRTNITHILDFIYSKTTFFIEKR